MYNAMKRKCCPKCGGTIIVSYLYQTSHDYRLTTKGKLSKKFTRQSENSMEVALASCEDCPARWEDGDFFIEADGTFWDRKYEED